MLAVNDTVTFEAWESQWELLGRGATASPPVAQHLTTLFAYLSRVVGPYEPLTAVHGALVPHRQEICVRGSAAIQVSCDLSTLELIFYGFQGHAPLRVPWNQSQAQLLRNIARVQGVDIPQLESWLPTVFTPGDWQHIQEYQRWIRDTIRIFDSFAQYFEGRSVYGLNDMGQLQAQVYGLEQERQRAGEPLWNLNLQLCDAKLGLPLWSTQSQLFEGVPRYRLRGEQLLKQAGVRGQTKLFSAFIERLQQFDAELLRFVIA